MYLQEYRFTIVRIWLADVRLSTMLIDQAYILTANGKTIHVISKRQQFFVSAERKVDMETLFHTRV
jgi:hypothetical protein